MTGQPLHQSVDLKPSDSDKVPEKDFPTEYKVLKFQNFDGHKENIKEHIAYFNSMGKYARIKNFVCESFLNS